MRVHTGFSFENVLLQNPCVILIMIQKMIRYDCMYVLKD